MYPTVILKIVSTFYVLYRFLSIFYEDHNKEYVPRQNMSSFLIEALKKFAFKI